jgi:hypothetical protein
MITYGIGHPKIGQVLQRPTDDHRQIPYTPSQLGRR